MHRITSRSPICSATKIHRSTEEKVRKIDVFRTFCDTTRRKIIATQFGDRKVNLRLILYIFRIHHFLVRRIFKFLIAHKVPALWRRKKTGKYPKMPSQLRIWIFDVPKMMYTKRCITMARLTSRCLNCVAINIRRVAWQNERETSIFRTFSSALR